MTLEIPFDKNIYLRQITLNFNTIWKANLKNNRRRLIWVVLGILIGGFMTNGKNKLGFLFIEIGVHYLINYIDYQSYYIQNKKRYFNLTDEEIKAYILV